MKLSNVIRFILRLFGIQQSTERNMTREQVQDRLGELERKTEARNKRKSHILKEPTAGI